MAFKLFYNDIFPLRMINFVKKYLDIGGMIQDENRVIGQLSKLQVIDYFYPSLFVRKLTESGDEAEYNYEICYILAPKKQGVLSNWGSYKQKINNLEDCLLGNSRDENTYKNYTAAHNMLRRAMSDLTSQETLCRDIVSNLQNIYTKQLGEEQKQIVNAWMGNLIEKCKEEKTIRICTEERIDGLSYDREVYDSLIEIVSSLYEEGNYQDCWTWMCLGSLFGNYISRLMKKYRPDFSPVSGKDRYTETYLLMSSPSAIVKPFFCGRDKDLEAINELFTSGNRVVFLYGIGGIGKTEIARQYARKYHDRYDVIVHAFYENSIKDLVIADTPFETKPTLPRLSFNGAEETDDAYFKRKLDVIKKASDERTLLVIDNFNTENDEYLDELINGRYRLLFTTQYDYSQNYPSLKIGEISDMEDLIDIFMHNYQGYAVDKYDPALTELIRSVNCHTFTIVLLAHHMENSGQSAEEMLEALNKEGIVSLSGNTDEAYQNLVRMFRVFEFSEEEQRVLQLLSLLPLSGTPPMVFKGWADLPDTSILLRLERRGWISRSEGGIALHPVVQKVVRHVLPVKDISEISSFLDRAADSIEEGRAWNYPTKTKQNYSAVAREIWNTVHMLPNYICSETERFFANASNLFSFAGQMELSESLGRELYEYCLKADGEYSYSTAHIMYRRGWNFLFNYQGMKSLENAENCLGKSYEIFSKLPMETLKEQDDYINLLANLSKLYSMIYETTNEREVFRKAREYAFQSLHAGEKYMNRRSGASLLRIADILMEDGELEEAKTYIDEAYEIIIRKYKDSSRKNSDVLRATSRRAKVLYLLGESSPGLREKALKETEMNLNAYREYYGTDSLSYFNQLVLKVQICLSLGKIETAKETQKQALETGAKLFSDHSKIITSLKSMI